MNMLRRGNRAVEFRLKSHPMRKSKVRKQFSAILVGVVVLMAILGVNSEGLRQDRFKFTIYWCIVLLLLLWVIGLVLVELLAIRLTFVSAKRNIFHKTIGDPTFLKKLRDSQENEKKQTEEQDGPR